MWERMLATNTHNEMEIHKINSVDENQMDGAIKNDIRQRNFEQKDKKMKWIVSLSQTNRDIFKLFGIVLIPIATIIIISTAASNGN